MLQRLLPIKLAAWLLGDGSREPDGWAPSCSVGLVSFRGQLRESAPRTRAQMSSANAKSSSSSLGESSRSSIRARASFGVMRAFLVQLQLSFNLFPGDSRLARVTLHGFTQLVEIFKIFNAFPQLGQFPLQTLQARL